MMLCPYSIYWCAPRRFFTFPAVFKRFSLLHTTDVFPLFGTLEGLAREIFLKPFHLIDVGRIPDEELRAHTWAGVMELVQKHIWSRDFLSIMKALAPLLRELSEQEGEDYIYGTLKYICNTADLNDPVEFSRIITSAVSSELGEKVMSLAKKWQQEGREEGLAKGRVEAKTA